MKAKQASAKLRTWAARLEPETAAGLAKALAVVEKRAVVLSSGTLTPKDLARLGHPYARRHGKPRRDPSRINVQSGGLRRGWTTEPPRLQGGALTGSVHNTDPKAEEVERGTPRTFGRPIADRVQKETEAQVCREIEKALARVFR